MHYRAHRVDYRALQIYLLQFYNSFVYAFPTLRKNIYDNTKGRDVEVMIRRKQMTMEEFDKKYGSTQLPLTLYASTLKVELLSEPQAFLPNSIQMSRNIKKAFLLQKSLDIDASIDYIYLKTTGIRRVRTGLTNLIYK